MIKPLALSKNLTRCATFRLSEKSLFFLESLFRNIPTMDFLTLWTYYSTWLKNSACCMLWQNYVIVSARTKYLCHGETRWVWDTGDVDLNSGSVTNLLEYDKLLHSKITCKTSGYKINYNLWELNKYVNTSSSLPGTYRRSACVHYSWTRRRISPGNAYGGEEVELCLSPGCLDKEDIRLW